ncbi:putative mitochondrial carrier domain superfamily [Helianthus anomalus]
MTAPDWQWENAVAGSVAGLATVTFSHPLDVVRTGFQVLWVGRYGQLFQGGVW